MTRRTLGVYLVDQCPVHEGVNANGCSVTPRAGGERPLLDTHCLVLL